MEPQDFAPITITHWVLSGILISWFLLSAMNQTHWFSDKFGYLDWFALLPKWTFFAPSPGIHDNHIVYRKLVHSDTEANSTSQSQCSDWQTLGYLDRSYIPLLWNPERRTSKTVSDIISNFLTISNREKDSQKYIPLTIEYLTLTNLVQSRLEPGGHLQWAIVRSHGYTGARGLALIYLSHIHKIEK